MPDPSGEPTPSSHEPPGGSPPSALPGEPSHLAPAPRAHPSSVQQIKSPAKTPAPPPGSRAVLEWLRQYGNLDLDPDEPILSATDEDIRSIQSRLPKEQRKFHKFDPEHPQPPPVSTGGSGPSRQGMIPSGLGEPDSSREDYPRGITAEQLAYIRRHHQNFSERGLLIALGIAVIAFLSVSVAFMANHLSPSAKPAADSHEQAAVVQPAPATAVILPSGAMDLLDQATTAETVGDYIKAIQLCEQARHKAGHIYGLNYHLASLCYKANEMAQVLPLLNLSISEGEEVAACYSLRGTLLNQSESSAQEPNDLEKATQLEPLNARFFFIWGEALRAAGKPELALPQLQRAVERSQEPALAAIYALKLRLTQIELEQGDALNGELNEKLRQAPPAGEWLLTAAALEMQRGDYAAAATTLDKMCVQVGEREVARMLKDVFFKRFARQPELARFFDVAVAP